MQRETMYKRGSNVVDVAYVIVVPSDMRLRGLEGDELNGWVAYVSPTNSLYMQGGVHRTPQAAIDVAVERVRMYHSTQLSNAVEESQRLAYKYGLITAPVAEEDKDGSGSFVARPTDPTDDGDHLGTTESREDNFPDERSGD